MKDFSKVKYLKFSADDYQEMNFTDVVIDLLNDTLVSGIMTFGGIDDSDKTMVDINVNIKDIVNYNYSIFAKVVDSGDYYLLDENMNVLYESHGYVPKLMDYYNLSEGFGDYIELLIDDIDRKHLKHADSSKVNFNNENEWTEVDTTETSCNLYHKGLNDGFDAVRRIIINDANDGVESSLTLSRIISLIANFDKNNTIES